MVALGARTGPSRRLAHFRVDRRRDGVASRADRPAAATLARAGLGDDRLRPSTRVNFVLHHELARRDLGSAEAAAGAMLPDLWRMADRRVRLARLESSPDAALDPVFVEGERLARAKMREAGLAAPRMGLFAHVLWEMCLDGELLRRRGFDAIFAEVRAALAVVSGGEARRAAHRHHFDRVARTLEERSAFEARMRRIVEELARGPWIEGYQTGDGIAVRLEGVRSRLGFAPLADEDRAHLARVADGLLDAARAPVSTILARPHATR
jgi:hypothetical protein